MTVKLTKSLTQRMPDPTSEAWRANADQRIAELQKQPATFLRVISDVSLPNGVVVLVPHQMGRRPLWVGNSIPRGGSTVGVIYHYTTTHPSTGAPIDPTQVIAVAAFAYGATITVDLMVL